MIGLFVVWGGVRCGNPGGLGFSFDAK